MEFLFNILKLFFPFFKETVFGEKDATSEHASRNRLVSFLIACLVVMFIFYYHNSYKYDEVIGANSTLAEEVAVLQANLQASHQSISQLQTDLAIARSRIAMTPQPAPATTVDDPPLTKKKHRDRR